MMTGTKNPQKFASPNCFEPCIFLREKKDRKKVQQQYQTKQDLSVFSHKSDCNCNIQNRWKKKGKWGREEYCREETK